MARLKRKEKQEKKSLLQRFDSFIGRQINKVKGSPVASVVADAVLPKAVSQVTGIKNKADQAKAKFVKETAQSTARNLATPFVSANKQDQVIPKTKIEKAVFGNEPVKSFKLRSQENTEAQKPIFGKYSKFTGPASVVASIALDAIPGGKGEKKAAEVAVEQGTKKGFFRTIKNFIKPTETVISEQGPAGKQLKNLLTEGIDKGEVEAAKRLAQINEAKLGSLKKAEKQNLLDVMEGRAKPLNKKVSDAYIIARTQTDEIGTAAKEAGVTVKRKVILDPKKTASSVLQVVDSKTGEKTFKSILDSDFPRVKKLIDDGRKAGGDSEGIAGVKINGKIYHLTAKTPDQMLKEGFRDSGTLVPTGLPTSAREALMSGKPVNARIKAPFEQMQNYYPHKIPSVDKLKKGTIREDVVENLVRQGIKPDAAEARKFVDDYIAFLDNGGRQESLIKYMVDSGQSKNAAEAFSNLSRYRNRTIKRSGSLEFSRDIDLPFYDPDPARVIPQHVTETAARLEQIKKFGQSNEEVNKLILDIRNSGGDAEFVRTAVDRILGIVNNADTPGAKVSKFLRAIQGFKLGLAAIPNMTQGVLNSLLAADLRAVGVGLGGLLTKEGKMFALRSGATADSVLSESIKESGALSKFLKMTGFTAVEKMNRTIAANAGKSYGTRLFKTVVKNPNNKRAVRVLEELGVNVNEALKTKSLNEDDILMIAKKFTDLTQFRSRPQDLPLFASSEAGKVFFQFKNFIYGQTRLLHKTTIEELKNKNLGRATRNLLILATAFPLAGEVVADIRSVITGKERDSKGLGRYFDNIAQVGAMGLLLDTIQAGKYGKGPEFLAGPSVSDAGELINAVGGDNKVRNVSKFLVKKTPIVGSRISDKAFPPLKEKKKSTKVRKLR